MPFVYMLRCCDQTIYVGSTTALEQRIDQHQRGVLNGYTKTRRPLALIWSLETESIEEAYALERKLHRWSQPKKLALAEGRFNDLPGLARSKMPRPASE